MSKFIEVKESKYGDKLLLNIDNISVIHLGGMRVLVNGTHGEATGWFIFTAKEFQKILDAIKPTNSKVEEPSQNE